MVTGGGKRAIVDHFDRSIELEHYLPGNAGPLPDLIEILEQVDELSNRRGSSPTSSKKEPRGLGDAVWTGAQPSSRARACAVLLADDVHRLPAKTRASSS